MERERGRGREGEGEGGKRGGERGWREREGEGWEMEQRREFDSGRTEKGNRGGEEGRKKDKHNEACINYRSKVH